MPRCSASTTAPTATARRPASRSASSGSTPVRSRRCRSRPRSATNGANASIATTEPFPPVTRFIAWRGAFPTVFATFSLCLSPFSFGTCCRGQHWEGQGFPVRGHPAPADATRSNQMKTLFATAAVFGGLVISAAGTASAATAYDCEIYAQQLCRAAVPDRRRRRRRCGRRRHPRRPDRRRDRRQGRQRCRHWRDRRSGGRQRRLAERQAERARHRLRASASAARARSRSMRRRRRCTSRAVRSMR